MIETLQSLYRRGKAIIFGAQDEANSDSRALEMVEPPVTTAEIALSKVLAQV